MKVIKPSYSVTFHLPEGYATIEQFIEAVARTCYKSEDRITDGSAEKLIKGKLVPSGHHAMLEHCVASARIIADRGLTHELVRHRIASFAQESTRYCNYSKGKFDGQITVIEQPGIDTPEQESIWRNAMEAFEVAYMELLNAGVKPQAARSVLPIGIKSEIVITANLREWMHVFSLRTGPAAHPIIRGVMVEIEKIFQERVPSIFGECNDD